MQPSNLAIPPGVHLDPQQQLTSPFAATVQKALSGTLFDGREVPLTKLTRQLSINLAESRARASLKQPSKSGDYRMRNNEDSVAN